MGRRAPRCGRLAQRFDSDEIPNGPAARQGTALARWGLFQAVEGGVSR